MYAPTAPPPPPARAPEPGEATPEAESEAGRVPAFYLYSAEWLRRRGRTMDAVQVVLSALELPAANATTLDIVADRLERYGAIDRAIELRERQAAPEPDRPQPKRLLGLALSTRATTRPATAPADLTRSVALLREVAVMPLDQRCDGIDLVALMEANALLPPLNVWADAALWNQRLPHCSTQIFAWSSTGRRTLPI